MWWAGTASDWSTVKSRDSRSRSWLVGKRSIMAHGCGTVPILLRPTSKQDAGTGQMCTEGRGPLWSRRRGMGDKPAGFVFWQKVKTYCLIQLLMLTWRSACSTHTLTPTESCERVSESRFVFHTTQLGLLQLASRHFQLSLSSSLFLFSLSLLFSSLSLSLCFSLFSLFLSFCVFISFNLFISPYLSIHLSLRVFVITYIVFFFNRNFFIFYSFGPFTHSPLLLTFRLLYGRLFNKNKSTCF